MISTVFNTPAPDELCLHIFEFAPDSTLVCRSVSRALKRLAEDFLDWNRKRIVHLMFCPDIHPFLERCICYSYISTYRPMYRSISFPGYNELLFHGFLRRGMLALGATLASHPVPIPEEVHCFNGQIAGVQNPNLQRVWGPLRQAIEARNPSLLGVPEEDASADEVRSWMHAHQNLLQAITFLNLRSIGLTVVPPELGWWCTGLQSLYLSNNQLRSLPDNIFQRMHQLEQLNLGENQLGSVSEILFRDLRMLQILDLEGNQLRSLSEVLFQDLDQLERLYLSNNLLTSLPAALLHGKSQLCELWLDNNQLSALPGGFFRGQRRLQVLFLQDNRFVTFSEEGLRDLIALSSLSLQNNPLFSLPLGLSRFFRQLKYFHF
jgi:hypothetical protein